MAHTRVVMTHDTPFRPLRSVSSLFHDAEHIHDAAPYQTDEERRRALAKLLPLWPHELEDTSFAGRQRVVALMARLLRAERARGRAGHWTYDLARHAALFRAYRKERDALRAFEKRRSHERL